MIETERLILKPLTQDQLVKYLKADNSLENELGLKDSSRIVGSELKEALETTLLPALTDKTKNYLYSTLWTAISKADNRMVGDICITGEPNAAGEIEIGYGTYEEFQGKGFMTEAVGGLISWARTEHPVKAIIATTNKDNIASFTILKKNSFEKSGETEEIFKWKLEIRK